MRELFKCHKHLKLNFLFVYWAINKGIIQVLQASKNQFLTYFNYNEGIIQISQISKTQFLACLLVLLARWPRFCLVLGLVGLIVGLAINGAELMDRKVAISFFGCFFWKELISLFRCWTADNSS